MENKDIKKENENSQIKMVPAWEINLEEAKKRGGEQYAQLLKDFKKRGGIFK